MYVYAKICRPARRMWSTVMHGGGHRLSGDISYLYRYMYTYIHDMIFITQQCTGTYARLTWDQIMLSQESGILPEQTRPSQVKNIDRYTAIMYISTDSAASTHDAYMIYVCQSGCKYARSLRRKNNNNHQPPRCIGLAKGERDLGSDKRPRYRYR